MLFRRPLHEVAAWPEVEVRLLEHYLAKQPAPEERIEIALAQLSAHYLNAHTDPALGRPPVQAEDQMPFHRIWEREEEAAAQLEWSRKALLDP